MCTRRHTPAWHPLRKGWGNRLAACLACPASCLAVEASLASSQACRLATLKMSWFKLDFFSLAFCLFPAPCFGWSFASFLRVHIRGSTLRKMSGVDLAESIYLLCSCAQSMWKHEIFSPELKHWLRQTNRELTLGKNIINDALCLFAYELPEVFPYLHTHCIRNFVSHRLQVAIRQAREREFIITHTLSRCFRPELCCLRTEGESCVRNASQ